MKKSVLFALICILFLNVHAQTNVYVSAAAANDDGDGTTWATAKKTLEAAMALVGSNGTVFVKAGTYNIAAELTIPANVTVLGGYSLGAFGADTSQRNLPGVNSHWQDETYCTIIKGDGTFRIATVYGLLDGCIVRDGFTETMGGGALIDGGTVRYCVIMGCDAVAEADASAEGGGAYIRNNGTLINCVVTECRGDNGSAVSGEDGDLINNTITRNWPSQCGTVTDYDGNTYHTVRLGNQCWMRENLRTTHYSDGTAIPTSSGYSETAPYYYVGNSNMVLQYGYYYNWPAVMNGAEQTNANPSGVQGICPEGWHVPSAAEWEELRDYVASMPHYRCGTGAGSITKALASRTNWSYSSYTCTPGNSQATNNATRFNAMPAGYYGSGVNYAGTGAYFSSTTNYNYAESSSNIMVYGFNKDWVGLALRTGYYEYSKSAGLTVRCVLDEE